MTSPLRTVLVALVLAALIGFVSGGQWPHLVMGALTAVTLWVVLFLAGSDRSVGWQAYTQGAAITAVLGSALFFIGGAGNGVWWAPAVIMAGVFTKVTKTGREPVAE